MRQGMLMAVLIGLVGAFVCIMYAIGATNDGPQPASYRAAVIRVLNEQRVDYRDVEVVDGCAPSYQFCESYAGSVRVLAATTMLGRIGCRERWTTCTLTVPRAGISDALLDDVRDPIAARWEALYGRILLRLCEIYRGKS